MKENVRNDEVTMLGSVEVLSGLFAWPLASPLPEAVLDKGQKSTSRLEQGGFESRI